MYEVSAHPIKEPRNNVVAIGSIVINGQLKIDSVKLVKKQDGELFLGMPTYLKKGGEDENSEYHEFAYPTNKEFRKNLQDAFIQSFQTGEPVKLREGEKERVGVFVEKSELFYTRAIVTLSISKQGSKPEKGKEPITEFLIPSIRVKASTKGDFVAMPHRKEKDGSYTDIIYPITKEYRTELFQEIMKKYEYEPKVKEMEETKSEETPEETTPKEPDSEPTPSTTKTKKR